MHVAGTLELATTVQNGVDQNASKAMQRITLEVREAKRVQILSEYRFRVFYPLVVSGVYDRFQEDSARYVEFVQGDARGAPSANGNLLWRKTDSGEARILAQDLDLLSVSQTSPRSITLTIEVRRQAGRRAGVTRLTNRVLYLRNS